MSDLAHGAVPVTPAAAHDFPGPRNTLAEPRLERELQGKG